jgi:hypothetical protein
VPAVKAACDLASDSGFVDGQNNRTVRVDLPPIAPSAFSGLPGYVEVQIAGSRPSFFEGILGIARQNTGAMGVATNQSDIALPYSLLALDPTDCGASFITGSPGTTITTNGTVHVDSSCTTAPGALQLSGNGVLNAPECDVVGIIQRSGGATNNCTAAPTGVLVSGDPLRNLPPPPKPAYPAAVQPLDGGPIPAGCPGNNPATEASPATCAFSSGQVAGKTYRIFPGYYPGGISTSKAKIYMDPGIYWIGGGGIDVQSSGGLLISKAVGDNSGVNPTGGVLIYDGVDPVPSTGCTGAGCFGPISMNGSPGATLALRPIQSGAYKGMVIYVDRATTVGTVTVILNGANSNLDITGTIYSATGKVQFNGSATDVNGTQVICYSFQVNGSGASFTMNYDPANLFHVTGVGLVQ